MIRKFIIAVFMVTSLAATALAAPYRNIGSAEAKALLDKKRNVFLLDVRTPVNTARPAWPGRCLFQSTKWSAASHRSPRGGRCWYIAPWAPARGSWPAT